MPRPQRDTARRTLHSLHEHYRKNKGDADDWPDSDVNYEDESEEADIPSTPAVARVRPTQVEGVVSDSETEMDEL